MPDESDEPTQRTPMGDERAEALGKKDGRGGLTIPVPEREDVMSALRKVAHIEDEPTED